MRPGGRACVGVCAYGRVRSNDMREAGIWGFFQTPQVAESYPKEETMKIKMKMRPREIAELPRMAVGETPASRARLAQERITPEWWKATEPTMGAKLEQLARRFEK